MLKKINFILIILLLSVSLARTQSNQTIIGELSYHTTIHSIGFEWNITGDANHNAICNVKYRQPGSTDWKDFLPLYRVDMNNTNTLAGSILFLKANTQYEVQLTLYDPDGGFSQQICTITTRAVPALPQGGRTFHVIPGSGGGDGSESNPFRGIETAEIIAIPGDIFLLHAGTYTGETEFNKSGNINNHIVWKGIENGEIILENIRIAADYVWLENMIITGNEYGIRTYSSPFGVVITRNTFTGCHYCIYLNHGGENWYITDNLITGDVDPASGDFGGEGIELQHTSGHVVAYNTISRVADGISYPHKNCDIYGNDIFDLSDDGIEGDYGYSNIRIWQNRISNSLHNGISFQPQNGAPWYILRNQVAAPLESAIKFRSSDRALIAHNTFVGWQGALKSGSEHLIGVQSCNNLWISITDWYVWENGSGGSPDWRTNLDYDGFDWADNSLAFKWGTRYSDLAAFNNGTGLEPNGVRVYKDLCFETFDIPNPPPAPMPKQYMTLKPDANTNNAIDAGVVLPGINNNFTGNAPDLGAYEVGQKLPHYGIRPSTPDINISSPEGGESWELGDIRNISWDSANLSSNIRIALWQNGTLIGIIAPNLNPDSGNYSWTVGNHSGGIAPIGSDYTIKIKEKGTTVADRSGTFSITAPSITIISPTLNENLIRGNIYNIRWNATNLSADIRIALWQNGSLIGIIASKLNPDSGNYNWTVGNHSGGIAPIGSDYTIKIKEKGTTVADRSDTFNITTPSITIISPTLNENLIRGNIYNIRWNATNLSSDIRIALWQNGSLIGIIASKLNPDSGNYSWTVGNHSGGIAPIGSDYTIKIKEKGTSVAEFSDFFNIITIPTD